VPDAAGKGGTAHAGEKENLMALAWVTRAVNDTPHHFTILQDDASWRPIVWGKRFAKDEPIPVRPLTRQGEPYVPFPPIPSITIPAPSDMVTDFPLSYCVVPWQGYGRLRLVGPSGKYIEYQVGRFVDGDHDHLRGVLSNGDIPLLVELGATGGAWWSVSYDFEIYVQADQGVRWNVQSVMNSPLPGIVAEVSEKLREMAPQLLKFLIS
jgi:hypothetical protein